MHKLLAAVAVAALAPCAMARAQTGTTLVTPIVVQDSPSQLGTVAGLMQTPVAALPPIITSTINGEIQKSNVYSLRYGYISGPNGFSSNNVGLTATLPLAIGSTLSFTGGAGFCNLCGTGYMGGISGDFRIYEMIFQPQRDPTRLMFTINANVGYASTSHTALSDGSVFGATVLLPISILPGWHSANELRFVPFVAPGIGFGSSSGTDRLQRVGPAGQLELVNESGRGTRFVVAGGIAVYRRGGNFALNFGAQYIPTHTDNILAGIGINYGGR
jgi:hypothetical protein